MIEAPNARLTAKLRHEIGEEIGSTRGAPLLTKLGFILLAPSLKEEDILFKVLSKKKLSVEYKKIMKELIEEHVYARKNVGALVDAKVRYVEGDAAALGDMVSALTNLTKLYPAHIEKEDKHFFLPVMKYLTRDEKGGMLEQFQEFDRKMIHEKYAKVVKHWEDK